MPFIGRISREFTSNIGAKFDSERYPQAVILHMLKEPEFKLLIQTETVVLPPKTIKDAFKKAIYNTDNEDYEFYRALRCVEAVGNNKATVKRKPVKSSREKAIIPIMAV